MEDLFGPVPETQVPALQFADVILPVPIPKLFSYRIPPEMLDKIGIGFRVIVPFGRRKILTGIVGKVHQKPPVAYEAKAILDMLDESHVANPLQINFWKWMADYYCCHIGEVMNAAIPSGLKISSESKVQLHPDFDIEKPGMPIDDREWVILEALSGEKELDLQSCNELLSQKSSHTIIKSLLAKGAILIFEELKDKYQPKTETRVRLHRDYLKEKSALESLFQSLSRAQKQEEVLLKYLQEIPVYQNPKRNAEGLEKKVIIDQGFSPSAVASLVKKGVFEEFKVTISRFEHLPGGDVNIALAAFQEQALQDIKAQFENKETVLLHGITGSGKTEIYINLIQEVLGSGSQVLLLLPEIALTTQVVARLQKVFGSKMGVFHSKYSDNERVEVWQGVLNGTYNFVVGVRSAVFLPFDSLGLVIVDEEHEASYKQYEPSPRFHGRDAAIMLAWLHQSKTLLGSATPSFESYSNARTGKYGLVQIQRRFGDAQLPKYLLSNMLVDKKKNLFKLDMTRLMREKIQDALDKQEQVLIFQNRRGYAPYISCEDCGWIPECEHCDVSLTYHQYSEDMRCHYCGFKEQVPKVCPACGSQQLTAVGLGTERIEENLGLLFPEARIARMDHDTTRSKYGYQRILEDFGAGNIDILVGTQMISKGLDFDRVTLVGVMDADRMLFFPDFRSGERAFQMITQVAGRAGRRQMPGTVILQSRRPELAIFDQIIKGDYLNFFLQEMGERKRFFYPPYVKNIKITTRHKEFKVAERASKQLLHLLAAIEVKKILLGPEKALIGKIKNQYLFEILVKLEKTSASQQAFKKAMVEAIQEINSHKDFKSVRCVVDVDPY
ncbi:replication restart helicase PriA [Pleomorphovibrio marinus]|uniref:replication restart helicase PriA n=1 Tax=Pleomorphovibrio marinus TaxID=2164132 RepID=UPI000E0CA6D4|nr:primosomal protein N' [Pleomorphovibrio marinus]